MKYSLQHQSSSYANLTKEVRSILRSNNINTIPQLFRFMAKPDSLSVNDSNTCLAYLRQTMQRTIAPIQKADSSQKIGQYLAAKYSDLQQEQFHVISISNSNRILADDCIIIGSLGRAEVDPRASFRAAILHNAAAVILMHNHPSGSLIPSDADLAATQGMIAAGQALRIQVLDHIIVAAGDYFSFAEHGEMKLKDHNLF